MENTETNQPLEENKPNLLIATVMWGRFDLFKMFVKHHQQFGYDILVIGSEGDKSRKLAEGLGCIYIEHPNLPLLSKFNRRISYFMNHKEYSHLFLIGSDDFLDVKGMNIILNKIKDYDIVQWKDIYYYDLKSGKSLYSHGYSGTARDGEPIAPGRCISRKVIESLNGKLWTENGRQSPDANLWAKLKGKFSQLTLSCKNNDAILLDVKSAVNKHSFSQISRIGKKEKPSTEIQNRLNKIVSNAKDLADIKVINIPSKNTQGNTTIAKPKNKVERREQIKKAVELRKKKSIKPVKPKKKKERKPINNLTLKTSKQKKLKKPKETINQFKKEIKVVKSNKKRIVIKRRHR